MNETLFPLFARPGSAGVSPRMRLQRPAGAALRRSGRLASMPSRFTTPLEPVAAPPALPPPSAVAPTRNSFRLGRAAAGPGPPAIRSDILYRWPDGGWQLGRVWCRRRQAPFTHRGVVGYRTATATVAGEVSSGAANRPDRLSARRPDRLSFYRLREPTGKRERGGLEEAQPHPATTPATS